GQSTGVPTTAAPWTAVGAVTLAGQPLNNVVAIAASQDYSLALKADGTVVGWGDNSYGQINIPPGLSNVVAVAAGSDRSLFLTASGAGVTAPNPGVAFVLAQVP